MSNFFNNIDMQRRMMIGNLDMALFQIMRPNPSDFQISHSKKHTEQLTNTGFVDTFWGNARSKITCNGRTFSRIGNPNQYNSSDYAFATLRNTGNNIANTFRTTSDQSLFDKSHGPAQWAEVERSLLKLEQIYHFDRERTGSLGQVLSAFGDLFQSTEKTKGTQTLNTGNNIQDLMKSIKNGTAPRASSFIIYNSVIYFGFFESMSHSEKSTGPDSKFFSYSFNFTVTQTSTDWISEGLVSNFPRARLLNFFSQIADVTSYMSTAVTNADKLVKGVFL